MTIYCLDVVIMLMCVWYLIICTHIGTEVFIKMNPSVLDLCEVDAEKDTICKKDTGDKAKLQMWSRGHFFIVRPCGHIDQWQPIYRCVDILCYVCVIKVVDNGP